MTLTASWVQAVSPDADIVYAAQDIRQWVAAIAAEGVCSAADLVVSQRAAGANFSVDVSAGRAIIAGDSVAYQGSYVLTNTAVVNVTVPAAPPSGTRVHRVVAHVYDRAADGGSTYTPAIEVLADTGSGTPALPATALHLKLITVTSTTMSITSANLSSGPALSRPVNLPVPARSTWTLPGDAANSAGLAPLSLVLANNRVTVEGGFRYTTGLGATTSRALPAIPTAFRALTDRGLIEWSGNAFAVGGVSFQARVEFNPATGVCTLYRADNGSFSWTNTSGTWNDWISLHGMAWTID